MGTATDTSLRARLVDWIPRGGTLPHAAWRERHRAVVVILLLHAAGLLVFAAWRDASPAGTALRTAVPLTAAIVALLPMLSPRARSCVAGLGLVATSSVLVELSGGAIEAHFHFFVMIPVVALYEDWPPFTLAVGYVLMQHGVVGTAWPDAAYNHPGAWSEPWLWASVHAVFFGAACLATIVNWRLHERSRVASLRLAREMTRRARHDELTGLLNRAGLLEKGRAALAAGRRPAVLLLDLDSFKEINDTLGHAQGDVLLREATARLQAALGPGETLARLGGDEFVALVEDPAGEEEARRAAERLAEALRGGIEVQGISIEVEASVGVAFTAEGELDLDDLLRQADVAMYAAKDARTGVATYDRELDVNTVPRLARLTELRRAIAEDELVVHYQPKVALAEGVIVGVEALVRWQHPERGLVPPAEFIPDAEASHLITPLTRRVLERALAQVAAWRDAGMLVPVAVNVSPRSLHDPALVGTVRDLLQDHALPAELLRLELTESTLMADPRAALEILEELCASGVRLSVDDFGTGYSSMSYLKRLPVDEIKIDRSFVRDMVHRADDLVLVRSAVDLGHNLGLAVVAEGVEDARTAEALRELHVDVLQGFHFGRPMPADEVTALLRAGEPPWQLRRPDGGALSAVAA